LSLNNIYFTSCNINLKMMDSGKKFEL